jgi:imidazolonepropionase-like amidohydrolase
LNNAARLHKAGVRIAFSEGETPNSRLTRQLAGNAVAHGLPPEAALAAITSAPADMFGLSATHGRIAVGQVADLVLWSGDPLEVTSLADQVWIAGHEVELKSRQTELRDRYWEKLKLHQAR